ncbi:unnamed protein product [Citrullus colocynthis]|uniref:Uncharacterized protein n=1 Tax=Citrullus colocynthis TaxID=252529 RepID=A0ABP0XLT9_9ROSI
MDLPWENSLYNPLVLTRSLRPKLDFGNELGHTFFALSFFSLLFLSSPFLSTYISDDTVRSPTHFRRALWSLPQATSVHTNSKRLGATHQAIKTE